MERISLASHRVSHLSFLGKSSITSPQVSESYWITYDRRFSHGCCLESMISPASLRQRIDIGRRGRLRAEPGEKDIADRRYAQRDRRLRRRQEQPGRRSGAFPWPIDP
jgi:hypothetical protein